MNGKQKMREVIQAVVQKIVAGYEPEKVILFETVASLQIFLLTVDSDLAMVPGTLVLAGARRHAKTW